MLSMVETVKKIMENISDKDIIVASTGFPSRAVFHYKDRPLNFYVSGAMGYAVGIGIGMALNTKRKVIVITGDGSLLMRMGTLALYNDLWIRQMIDMEIHVLNNNCYCATGGQPTCMSPATVKAIKLLGCKVHDVKPDKPNIGRITLSPEEITARFKNAVSN